MPKSYEHAMANGWEFEVTRGQHLRATRGEHSVVGPKTPSDGRSDLNTRAQMRRCERGECTCRGVRRAS
jgi:hypothetical protein